MRNGITWPASGGPNKALVDDLRRHPTRETVNRGRGDQPLPRIQHVVLQSHPGPHCPGAGPGLRGARRGVGFAANYPMMPRTDKESGYKRE
jgi:hypothetical protein